MVAIPCDSELNVPEILSMERDGVDSRRWLMSRRPVSQIAQMSASETFSVVRTVSDRRPALGRWEWEVLDAAGNVIGLIAEERRPNDMSSTFTALHNPTEIPFRPPPGRRLRALGAWSSGGHPTVPAAVAALAITSLVGSHRRLRPAEA